MGRNARLEVSLLIALCIATGVARADDIVWKPVKDDDGVRAWTRDDGERLPIARAMTTVDAPLCDVLAIVRDVERHCEWMADCVETRVLQQLDWARLDMYLRIKGYPWLGVADRDVLLQTRTVLQPAGDAGEVSFSDIDEPKSGLGSDTVHMPRLKGVYALERVDGGKTQVEYRFEADLGGWVPDWIAKKTVEELPWKTLVNLRQQATQHGVAYRPAIRSWPRIEGASPCSPPSPRSQAATFSLAASRLRTAKSQLSK
jgi:hypothetical protein